LAGAGQALTKRTRRNSTSLNIHLRLRVNAVKMK
jgi:hypothetical protein